MPGVWEGWISQAAVGQGLAVDAEGSWGDSTVFVPPLIFVSSRFMQGLK